MTDIRSYESWDEIPFDTLKGKILASAVSDGSEIVYTAQDGTVYKQYHEQDCCEDVWLEDVCGDLSDLVGSEILLADETSSLDEPQDGCTTCWTFYHLRTQKGTVTLRFFGVNGKSNCYALDAPLHHCVVHYYSFPDLKSVN